VKYAWLVIAIFTARFASTAIVFPSGDGDLAWQRWLGGVVARAHAIPRALGNEVFSAPAAPWLPQEWAFSLAANAARRGLAWDLFAGGIAFAAVAALALSAARAERRGGSPRAVALCTAFAGFGLFESFGVRAQVVAWPLVAAFLWALELESPWCWLAFPLAALWSNLHASAVLAPLLAGLSTFGAFLDEGRFGPRSRRALLLTAAALLAICCNPFGWELPAYAVSLFGNPIKSYISEWKVTDLDDISFAAGALPLLSIATIFGLRSGPGPRRWGDLLILAAFAFLLLSAARNVSLFALVALPLVAPILTRARLGWFAPSPPAAPTRTDRIAAVALPTVALAMALVVAVGLVRSAPPATGLANAPLAALAALPGEHHVFCADFAWCGLAVGEPHVQVFLDGRADPFPRAVWEDFAAVVRVAPSWEATLDRRHVDAVVVTAGTPLDQALGLARDWRSGYADKTYRLWLRRGSVAAQPPRAFGVLPRVVRAPRRVEQFADAFQDVNK
jgi:hypothetical protein